MKRNIALEILMEEDVPQHLKSFVMQALRTHAGNVVMNPVRTLPCLIDIEMSGDKTITRAICATPSKD